MDETSHAHGPAGEYLRNGCKHERNATDLWQLLNAPVWNDIEKKGIALIQYVLAIRQRRRKHPRCGATTDVTSCGLDDFRWIGYGFANSDSEDTGDEDTDDDEEEGDKSGRNRLDFFEDPIASDGRI